MDYATRCKRWLALCERLGIDEALAMGHFLWLNDQYSDPDRFLHNWDHIDDMLVDLDMYRSLATNCDLVEYAIWNHDSEIVFQHKPRGYPTDEALSARAADNPLVRAGKPFEMRKASFGLIGVTDHREDTARTTDEMLIADIDWSGLGYPWERYIENRGKVRRERSYMSDKEFNNARAIWVGKAARRKSHFYLPLFQEKYDAQVQANLTRELNEFRMQ